MLARMAGRLGVRGVNRRLTIPTHLDAQMATEPDLAGAGSRLKGRPVSRPGGLLIRSGEELFKMPSWFCGTRRT